MARVLKRTLKGFLIVFLLLVGIGTCFSPPKETPASPVASHPSTSEPASSQAPPTSTPSQPTSSQPSTEPEQPQEPPATQLPPPPPPSAEVPEQPTTPTEPEPETPSEPTTITGNLAVHFIDVGQGDSVFITLPDGTSMLIDAGPGSASNTVVSTIKALGNESIDYAVFTHPHEDHIGGAPAVFQAFDVKGVWMPRTSHTTQAYENMLLAIEREGLMIDEATAGKVIFDRGNLRAWLLNPSKADINLNNMSAVVALTYDTITFIFAGDAESEAEAAMVRRSSLQLPDCDVLKVAHHGSSTSTTTEFLEAVSPEIAVISVGAGNSYEHPAQSTLDRLTARGAEVYRTDQHGTVTITTDGTTLDVTTEKTPQTETSASATPDDITVYITKTGSKYHRDGCRHLSQSKISISLQEAKARGFGPCSVCKPPS